MRVSTNQFYKVNGEQMSTGQSKVAELQTKLGSGKQMVKPSEDPGKANLISGLEGAKKRQEVYTKNVDAAETRLTAESAVLESMTTIMQRITQLTVQSASDTLGASDREVIATEIEALRDELLNLTNTQDLTGAFIFSGNKTNSPAFVEEPPKAQQNQSNQYASATASLNSGGAFTLTITPGTGSAANIPIGAGSDTPEGIVAAINTANLPYSATLQAEGTTGSKYRIILQGVGGAANTFVVTSTLADQDLGFHDENNGNVMVNSGIKSLQNPEDQVVSYNGDYGRHEINVSDVRSIAINTLGPDLFSAADFAALDDLVTDLRAADGDGVRTKLANVNSINDRLINSYGAMAGRLAAIESQRSVIDETTLRIDELLLREDDLDYAEAVTELSKESVALQALQASFVKVAQLSLFNFLR